MFVNIPEYESRQCFHVICICLSDNPRVAEIFSRWHDVLNAELLCVGQQKGSVGDGRYEIAHWGRSE